jgi:hypothetical protein
MDEQPYVFNKNTSVGILVLLVLKTEHSKYQKLI